MVSYRSYTIPDFHTVSVTRVTIVNNHRELYMQQLHQTEQGDTRGIKEKVLVEKKIWKQI